MNLLNASHAVVEQQKIVDYLLNPAHPDNGGKARFFTRVGFSVTYWQLFAEALREMAAREPILREVRTLHGQKFTVDGEIPTPAGRPARVRTVWIIDKGGDIPRLVTAHPRD